MGYSVHVEDKITLIADVKFFDVDREITTGSSVELFHSGYD